MFVLSAVWAATWQNQHNDLCTQRGLRSAWASARSDQSLRCTHEESLDPYKATHWAHIKEIRLGGCPGSSESLQGACRWFCRTVAHLSYLIWFWCVLFCSFSSFTALHLTTLVSILARIICEPSQVLLAGGQRLFFSGIYRFRSTLRLTRLKISEILTGRKLQIKMSRAGYGNRSYQFLMISLFHLRRWFCHISWRLFDI